MVSVSGSSGTVSELPQPDVTPQLPTGKRHSLRVSERFLSRVVERPGNGGDRKHATTRRDELATDRIDRGTGVKNFDAALGRGQPHRVAEPGLVRISRGRQNGGDGCQRLPARYEAVPNRSSRHARNQLEKRRIE